MEPIGRARPRPRPPLLPHTRPGPGVFPQLHAGREGATACACELPSLGASRFVPLVTYQTLESVEATSPVADLGFIPVYHAGPLTDSQPARPLWSQHRDELLAGRPVAALAELPRSEDALAGEQSCQPMSALAGVARLELGQRVPGARRGALQYARENMWRWAGDLPRAERAAGQWARQAPGSASAAIQLGEIDFLRTRFDEGGGDIRARHPRRARRSPHVEHTGGERAARPRRRADRVRPAPGGRAGAA